MLSYPYAEGPRYSMVSSEIFVRSGFEDALNIDRDSFNELHPHYIRVQSYMHALLHELIFPETWGEEKQRNRQRKVAAETEQTGRFVQSFERATGEAVRGIRRVAGSPRRAENSAEQPVQFQTGQREIEINSAHPLLQPLFRRKKYAPLIEKIVVAFERANAEAVLTKRRELFYKLLADIFADM